MSLRVDERDVPLTPKARVVVSALAIDKSLTTGQMIEWISATSDLEADPEAVHEHVRNLRAAIRSVAPESENLIPRNAKTTYRFDEHAATIHIDVERFEQLAEQARQARPRDLALFVRLSREAMAVWGPGYRGLYGGEPLAGLVGPKVDEHQKRLRGLFRMVRLGCLEAELELGRHRDVLPELQAMVNGPDLDQTVVYLLMLALHRDGRSEEALTELERARDRVMEYGGAVDRRLKTLFQDIKRDNPVLDLPLTTAPVAIARPLRGALMTEEQPTPPVQPFPHIDHVELMQTGANAKAVKNNFEISGTGATIYSADEMKFTDGAADSP
ncbi:hypothetical protein Hesp01_18850 [Herbidospora sp. NBRC 101105]|nr:hypothetical protein Hesp01_18850 [Herbidospora sp. NBRC 101105]